MAPAQPVVRLGRIADQQIDLGRAEIARIDRDADRAGGGVYSRLVDPLAAPLDRNADLGEGQLDQFAHRVGLAGGQHIVVGLVLLGHHPHAADIVAGVAPVALGVEIAEIEPVDQAELDAGDGAGDLARDEGLAAQRAFVVEQDAVRGVQAIGLAIVHHHPVGIELGRAIGAARIEGRGLALGDLLHLAEQFRGRGLIESGLRSQPQKADRLQQPEHAQTVGVGGIFGGLEADLDMALGGQVVDLVRLRLLHDADQVGRIGHVAEMQDEARIGLVRILVQMIDAAGVERGRAPLHSVHHIVLGQQQLGQIGAVLAGHPGDQCDLAALAHVISPVAAPAHRLRN